MELDFDVVDLPAADHVAAGDDAPTSSARW